MMKKYQSESNAWLLSKVETWEANQVDPNDETDDEGIMGTGSRTVNGPGIGMADINGGVVAST